MKKILLLLACGTMMATSAMAQMSLVKEIEKVAGSSNVQELTSALTGIQPALTNPETMNNAQTWLAAGKVAFKIFDQLQAMKQLNQPIDEQLMSDALTTGFDYMFKALPLDSVKETNKDGTLKLQKNGQPKIKTKYSKEIIQSLISHMDEAGKLADDMRMAENYASAAKAYGTFANLVTSPFAKAQKISYPDSTVSEIKFLEGFCHFFAKDYVSALPPLMKSKAMGYTANQINEFVVETLQNIVQKRVDEQDFASAYKYLDDAIAADNSNVKIYDIKGRVFEIEDESNVERVIDLYKNVVALDPNYAPGYFGLGRAYCLKAQNIINDNPNMNNNQLKEILAPIYQEAEPLLEKVSMLDPGSENANQAKRLIEDIDYKKGALEMK